MTRWTLTVKDHRFQRIDASMIRRRWLAEHGKHEIEQARLIADGLAVPLGDLFQISVAESAQDEVVIEGTDAAFDRLGAGHDRGLFRAVGDVGDAAGCGLQGGRLLISGSAGDNVGAPWGSRKSGQTRGEIEVIGDVGDYAGHRMRRGTLTIGGAAGAFLAASMVAGTIVVGGAIGRQACAGMRRGSLLLASPQNEAAFSGSRRFSEVFEFSAGFLPLFSSSLTRELLGRLADQTIGRVRADRQLAGLGEVLFPRSA
ncbi:GltB/FmdC/FwdC-like GXGXG domain-containing protein [Roseiconus lacunae]|uniref:GltB/FmdC/FwdC-like GXGXG domain-containing protein n=1 Tax=Roseiconus lacunae TaxID=2605694 RepID=UPI0011F0BE6E|nr:hypothetical protein [Roseiconus lacunae]